MVREMAELGLAGMSPGECSARGAAAGCGPLLTHFQQLLRSREAELPPLVDVPRLREAPPCLDALCDFRVGRGMPVAFPASWCPDLVARREDQGPSVSVSAQMAHALRNAVEVEALDLDFSETEPQEGRHSSDSAIDDGAPRAQHPAGIGTDPEGALRLHIPPRAQKVWMPFRSFVEASRQLGSSSNRRLLYLTWRALPADVSNDAQRAGGSGSALQETAVEGCSPECEPGMREVVRSILAPAVAAPFLTQGQERERNMWLGCSASSQIHFDALDNLHVCLEGCKALHLYSPWDSPAVYPSSWRATSLNNKSDIASVFTADRERHSRFFDADLSRLSVVLGPGDAVFIPAGWWHEVFTIGGFTVSANVWFSAPSSARLRPTLMMLHSHAIYQRMLRGWHPARLNTS